MGQAEQINLFEGRGRRLPLAPRFNGAEYLPPRDDARLTGQLQRVYDLMADGRWRTLGEIGVATGDPQPSISAQLRHLRKARFGGHQVERRYQGEGLFAYRLTVKGACA